MESRIRIDLISGTKSDKLLSLLDYIPLEDLQQLQDTLADINEITFLITDTNANLLTMPSNEIKACRLFHRSRFAEANCLANMQSTALAVKREGKQIVLANCPLGLFTAAAPIILDSTHVATLWLRKPRICRSLDELALDWDKFEGLEVDILQTELSQIQTCSKDDIDRALGWLNSFAKQINQLGNKNLTLTRHQGRLNRLESELDHYKAQLDDLVDERTADLINANKRLQLEMLERDLAEEQIERKSKLIDAINLVLRQTLTELGENDLFDTFLGAAQQIADSSFGLIIEKAKAHWVIAAMTPIRNAPYDPLQGYPIFPIDGIWQKLIDEGEPLMLSQPETRTDWTPLPKGFPSFEHLLLVPLLQDGRVTGLVALVRDHEAFLKMDCEDVEALSSAFMGALMRKRLAIAKYQSEKRLNLAMDAANQGLWDYFPESGHLYFSPSWFSMLGYQPHEFPTSMETWTTLTHPEDTKTLDMGLESVVRGQQETFAIEVRMLGKEGHWRWINVRGRAVEHGSNNLAVRIVGTLSDISKYKRIEMALQKANEELQRLAALDDLTQIANRRRFDDRLNQEWRRARRENKPLALIICDIDFFKRYNDTYGHLKGDDTLHSVAQTLSDLLKRPMDLVARFGGEEFAALLPNTNIKGAMRVANEFKAAIDGLNIEHQASDVDDHVTLSFGVAALIPSSDMFPKTLIESADKALYKAKALGRNTIVKMPGHKGQESVTDDEAA